MAGKNGEGDKGNGDGKPDISKDPAIIEMRQMIKGLGVLVQQGQVTQTNMQTSLNTLVQSIKDSPLGKGDKGGDDGDDDAINDLENKELVDVVLREVGKMMDTKLEGLTKQVEGTDQRVTDSAVAIEVKALKQSNPDLFEWKTEISDLTKQHPTLSVKQLYEMARTDNPEKSKEMDDKIAQARDDDKGTKKPELFGFMPTSGVTAGDEKLTKEEAKEKAWDETLSEFPELAVLGES